jgi:hypothetical protein
MKRIIVDFKKLTPEILSLLVDKYPDGYDDDNGITFKNAKNETVVYLVKVSSRLESSMANFDEDDYEDTDFQEPISEIPEKKKTEEVDDVDDVEDEFDTDFDDDIDPEKDLFVGEEE